MTCDIRGLVGSAKQLPREIGKKNNIVDMEKPIQKREGKVLEKRGADHFNHGLHHFTEVNHSFVKNHPSGSVLQVN